MREAIIFYLKPFPVELSLARLFKHEFKDIFQENDWCFDGKKLNLKPGLKGISSHLKDKCPTKPLRYKRVCEQNMCYNVISIFAYILILMIQFASIFS